MRRLRVVIAILLIGAGIADAAPVSGRVVDAQGKPVRGATITLEGAVEGAVTTDANGHFAIVDAPEGASLIVTKDGFGVSLATAGQTDDVVLLAESSSAETIEIKGAVGPTTQGSAKLTRNEVQRLPGTGNDIVRLRHCLKTAGQLGVGFCRDVLSAQCLADDGLHHRE